MRDKCRQFLKRIPFVYGFAQVCYWKMRHAQALISGTSIQERYWEKRHIFKVSDLENYEKWFESCADLKACHRKYLIDRISRISAENILEFGCNYGPNLYLLAKKNPKMKLTGIDINAEAIRVGKKMFSEEAIFTVDMMVGKTEELKRFPDKSFDVLFTDAVLIYIGPDKIEEVIREMLRITRKTLIFLEWDGLSGEDDRLGLGVYHLGYWKRNYKNLLKRFIGENKIKVMKIDQDFWGSKSWRELGCLIEVNI